MFHRARVSTRASDARTRDGARDDASFMRWLGDATNDASLVDKIEIQERAKTFGTRGMAAVRDLAPGETLLRVPWRLVSRARQTPMRRRRTRRVVGEHGHGDIGGIVRWERGWSKDMVDEITETGAGDAAVTL